MEITALMLNIQSKGVKGHLLRSPFIKKLIEIFSLKSVINKATLIRAFTGPRMIQRSLLRAVIPTEIDDRHFVRYYFNT